MARCGLGFCNSEIGTACSKLENENFMFVIYFLCPRTTHCKYNSGSEYFFTELRNEGKSRVFLTFPTFVSSSSIIARRHVRIVTKQKNVGY